MAGNVVNIPDNTMRKQISVTFNEVNVFDFNNFSDQPIITDSSSSNYPIINRQSVGKVEDE